MIDTLSLVVAGYEYAVTAGFWPAPWRTPDAMTLDWAMGRHPCDGESYLADLRPQLVWHDAAGRRIASGS